MWTISVSLASREGRSSLLPALRALSASADGKGKVYEHQRAHAGPETTIMSIDKSQTRETAACAAYEIQKGACFSRI